MANKQKLSKDVSFLSAYHAAKLYEFDYIHTSGSSIDTKASVIIAGNFAVLTILLTQVQNMNACTLAIAALCIVNILIGFYATSVRNYQGPVADIPFKKDTTKSTEAEILLQLIEDTSSYSDSNLKVLKEKRILYIVQIIIILITLIFLCISWIN